jgi:hypothetical protein
MLSVFEYVFIHGCGLQLADVLRSTRFQLFEAQTLRLMEDFPADTDQGVALRAGYQVFGQLINTFPESEALRLASSIPSTFGHGREFRPLLQLLGEAIVAEATNCLTDKIKEAAEEWCSASVDRQIQICDWLYHELRSENQGELGKMLTPEMVMEKTCERLSRKDSEPANYLPKLYGPWHKENPANCQGKTQMLVAFARLAGARVLAVHPLEDCRQLLEKVRYAMVDEAVRDCQARNLQMDSGMAESFLAHQMEKMQRFKQEFHLAVAIELKDGRWALLDPHGMSWGVFPEIWEVPQIAQQIEKYAQVLPGMCVSGHDHGVSAQQMEERWAVGLDQLERSRRMEDKIHQQVINMVELMDLLAESDDLSEFIRLTYAEQGQDASDFIKDPLVLKTYAMLCVFGENVESPFEASMQPGFLETTIDSWLTTYHVNAVNLFLDQLTESGQLLHPVCDFALPEYSLAVGAINSASLDINVREDRFFPDYSWDQTTLHNAIVQRGDWELARVARKTAASLRFVHPNVRYFV